MEMNRTMRSFVMILFVAMFSSGELCFGDEATAIHQKLGAEITTCPLGHANILAVPVMYGLIKPDAELKQKLENHELILGGCVAGSFSPAYNGCCKTCGYTYNPMLKTWELQGGTTTTFALPLNAFIKNFPVPGGLQPEILQTIQSGQVFWENMSFAIPRSGSKDFNELQKLTQKYLTDTGIQFETERDRYDGQSLHYKWGAAEAAFEISVYQNLRYTVWMVQIRSLKMTDPSLYLDDEYQKIGTVNAN